MAIKESLKAISQSIPEGVTLVAVSKTKPNEAVLEAYETGQRVFGENKVQELVAKQETLPKDIEWHMIGHLQRNKVKYIAPFVSLIHGIDSLKLLREVNKQGAKIDRIIPVLLQVHIAEEESKFGFSKEELFEIFDSEILNELKHVQIRGLMGMATNTQDMNQVRTEFNTLKSMFDQIQKSAENESDFSVLSMGMSGDYQLAIECGSTMVRVGSSIFGARNYS